MYRSEEMTDEQKAARLGLVWDEEAGVWEEKEATEAETHDDMLAALGLSSSQAAKGGEGGGEEEEPV